MDKEKENFFDIDKFAGDGNIGHIIYQCDLAMKMKNQEYLTKIKHIC